MIDHPSREFTFEFHAPDFDVPHDVVEYTAEKLRAKLTKFARWIIGVTVYVKDQNGTKNGEDKVCHIEARMAGLEPVNVHEQHHDLRACIDCAVEEMEQSVHRHTERVRTRRRERGRKIARHAKLGV